MARERVQACRAVHRGSRGRTCAKGPATLDQIHDPERILVPLKRKGKRGSGEFEEVGWEEALDDIGACIRLAIGGRGPGGTEARTALRALRLTERTLPPDPGCMRIPGATALVLAGSLSLVGPLAAQEDATALVQRASRLVEQQRYSEALEVLDRCLAADATKAKLHVMRASVRSRLGDHAGAIEDASRAIELDPQDFRGFYERGFNLHRQGELARALADYDRAIALEPGIAALHGERGDCLSEMDALSAAVAAYDAAIELSPTWVEAYTGRARALNALTDYAAALRDLRHATELAPEQPDLWWLRAFSEAQCGDDAAALRSAEARAAPARRAACLGNGTAGVPGLGRRPARAGWQLFARTAQVDSPNAVVLLCLGHVQLVAGNLDAAVAALEDAARYGDPRQLGRARMMQWCIDARTLGLDEAGKKLEERLGERIEELSAFERDLVGFCGSERTTPS